MDDKIQIQSIAKINKLGYRIIPKGNKLIFVKQKGRRKKKIFLTIVQDEKKFFSIISKKKTFKYAISLKIQAERDGISIRLKYPDKTEQWIFLERNGSLIW